MTFDKVFYRNHEGEEELVVAEELSSREDYEFVKKNLHCSYEGCTSRIRYVMKGKKKAYFTTWPKDNHSEACLNYFEREKKNPSIKRITSDATRLSEKHISSILREMIKVSDESQEEKEARSKKQKVNRNNKKNKITDITKSSEIKEIARPSTDGNLMPLLSSSRAPNVKRKYGVVDLKEEDVGRATCLVEMIHSMELSENRVVIGLKNKDSKKKVYMEEGFFATAYANIDTMFSVIKEAVDTRESLKIYCVGNAEKRDGELCLVINDQKDIRINGKKIDVFAFNYKERS